MAIRVDPVLAFVAFLAVLFIFRLGSLGALLFLSAGLALLARRPHANLGAIWRDGWILLLPMWCVLSVLWSTHPALSLRYGIQLGLTSVIALVIAQRLQPRTLLRTLFMALALAALASFVLGRERLDGAGFLGIYGSKNALAQVTALFVVTGMALGLGRDGTRVWRIAGLVSVLPGLLLLVMANSVGWLSGALLAVVSGIVFGFMRRLPRRYRLLALGLILLIILSALLLAWANEDAVLAWVFEVSGKDVTLTGRTYLWQTALSEIARHPLEGQGYQAVWVLGNPLAESLWREFGIASKTGFHFHNTWLSNAVEIGIIGVVLQGAIFLVALVTSLWRVLRVASAQTLFAAMLMVLLSVMSLVEVVGFQQFQIMTMLIFVIAAQGRASLSVARRYAPREHALSDATLWPMPATTPRFFRRRQDPPQSPSSPSGSL
ncbi:O-antigen ligase family protein [Thioclava sp.]|uniref:O-antigen ligase family protein n=1 Tax=Thioclava sp. TaxID=1933450 RepID=UPI003AA7D69D